MRRSFAQTEKALPMKMNLKELARKLDAEIGNGWLNIRGPGHGKNDRSLGIRFDPAAPCGFRAHSFACDDEEVCKSYVKELLKEIAKSGSICLTKDEGTGTRGPNRTLALCASGRRRNRSMARWAKCIWHRASASLSRVSRGHRT